MAAGHKMSKKSDKTIPDHTLKDRSPQDQEHMDSATVKIPRDAFIGEIPMKQRAYLEIIGISKKEKVIELAKEEILVGRSPKCDIQLQAKNVSRKHALVVFRNEEYHIKDLESTNGTYVNGVRVVKCILRNHDQIEIAGVKLLFSEEKTLQKT